MHSMTSGTGANPRYPLISELKQILLDTYYGREFVEGEAGAKAEVAPVKAEKKRKNPLNQQR
ncbi:alcohol dehydrogenase [Klebsiella pneumoniae]|uniref:Alcohol dehydrogenase n=1 Tax=Klebsiella pneumoniae TaxID=573 RepID=A0A377X9R0_KLEPN|nr:alcohol dehydrogenase [Klebsiella pneumoniae]